MAFRLADLVVEGEINNTRRNAVHGWLRLRDTDQTIVLSLTGNCHDDLAGRRFRFEPRRPFEKSIPPGEPGEAEAAALQRLGIPGFALEQVGPTGEMTAARKVRVADCSTPELVRRMELGEPPPMEWKPCLYLEWHSQNGRVVVEIPDPKIEFIDDNPEDDPWTDLDAPGQQQPGDMSSGLSVTSIRLDEDGEFEIDDETFVPDEPDDEDEPEDEYGLIPGDLQRHLDAQSTLADWAVRHSVRDDDPPAGDDDSDALAEMELMDAVMESGEGEPLGNIFKGVIKLRSPDALSEEQAEQELKAALGHMAMYGVALHICEHYTPREAYRLLVEKYCREECFHPELMGTRWVQHLDTAESCKLCQDRMEREPEQDSED